MASINALAVRRGEVENQLTALAARVQARLATPLAEPRYSKDGQIAAIERLEYLAGLLEATLGPEDAAREQVVEDATDGESGNEVRPAAPRESEPAPAPAEAQPAPTEARPNLLQVRDNEFTRGMVETADLIRPPRGNRKGQGN